jgi:sulfur carrier protein ThiS
MGFDSMKIKVRLVPSNTFKVIEVNKNATVLDLLQKMLLKPDTVIVTKNNIPIPIDEVLTGIKELTIIQVASGG